MHNVNGFTINNRPVSKDHPQTFSFQYQFDCLSLPENGAKRSAEFEIASQENAPVSVSQEFFECLKASQDLKSVGQRAHPLTIPARKGRDVTKDAGFGLRISAGLNGFAQCGSDGDFVEDRHSANHGDARKHNGVTRGEIKVAFSLP